MIIKTGSRIFLLLLFIIFPFMSASASDCSSDDDCPDQMKCHHKVCKGETDKDEEEDLTRDEEKVFHGFYQFLSPW